MAPSLWALVALSTVALSRASLSYTALRVLAMKHRNLRFSLSVFPGDISPMPLSVPRDQLQCFPDPFMPAKGFSCRSTSKPCLSATDFMTDMSRRLWSMARFAASYTGAISNWFGATSLCLVFTGMPNL